MSRRLLAVAAMAAITLAGCSSASSDLQLVVGASIDGRPVADSSPRSPIRLDPEEVSVLTLEVDNRSSAEVEVRRVRLVGELLDLTFLTYDVRVGALVPAGTTRTIDVPLDFFDLERQASGYLHASVRTYGTEGEELSNEAFTLDVRGDVTSMMNLFALLLVLLTALSAVRNLRDTLRSRLPANRFVRGARFALTGLGVGLVVSVGLAVLRVVTLPPLAWVPLTVITTGVGFAFGYVVTSGADQAEWEEDEPWDDDPWEDHPGADGLLDEPSSTAADSGS